MYSPCSGKCSVIPRKAGLYHTQQWLGKTNALTPNVSSPLIPLPFFFPQLSVLSMKPCDLEYPCGQLGSAVLDVSPPSSLCTCSLHTDAVGYRAGKALALCKHCPAITKISLCYQDCLQHKTKHSPIPGIMNFTLTQIKLVHSTITNPHFGLRNSKVLKSQKTQVNKPQDHPKTTTPLNK